MKKKSLLITMFFLGLLLVLPFWGRAGINEGITYLEAQTPNPWITQAFVAGGKTNVSTEHLTTVSGTLATDYAKTILALTSSGEDPTTFGNIDYIAKLKTYLNNDQIGDTTLLNDDMWAILALCSYNECGAEAVQKAKVYIIANQNTDGGWAYNIGGQSDSNDTAAAIMSLLETGLATDDAIIVNAINYLKTTQNDDGGFGYDVDSESDSGSDSWVLIALNKLSIDPATWLKNGNNPLEHMNSLQDSDGGYWWVSDDSSNAKYNNKNTTPYAVIALAGKSFPIAYYEAPIETGYKIRIEGANNTICDTRAEGNSVLDVVENASLVCGYTYNIQQKDNGAYLNQINEETASGNTGWLYFVNYVSPPVGMADYVLAENDEILLYFGEWGWKPTRLTVADNDISNGELGQFKAEYFEAGAWHNLVGADILGVNQVYKTDDSGNFAITFANGFYQIRAEKAGYIRSNQVELLVGGGVSQSISLAVEVESPVVVGGEALIFSVTPDSIDFGKMKAGQTSEQTITLNNSGTVDVALSSVVEGDALFTDNIKIADTNWSDFYQDFGHGQVQDTKVSLSIPADYLGSGVKSGDLIVWASPK